MDKIELFSPEILETHKKYVELVDDVRFALGIPLGWHYILDIPWVIKEIERLPKFSIIVDAGGSLGILSWTLTLLRYRVISVDFNHVQSYFLLIIWIRKRSLKILTSTNRKTGC